MKKYILQKGLTDVCAFLVLAVVWTLAGVGWEEWLLFATLAVSAVWSINVFDEFFATVIWYRYCITWQFLALTAIFAGGLVLFCFAAFANSMVVGIVLTVLCVLAVIGGIVFHWYLYKKKNYQTFETDQLKWLVQVCREMKGKSVQEVEDYVYGFLRFYPKRACLEAPLAIGSPIDPTHKLRTIKEMNEQDAGEEYVMEATNRVHDLVVDYCNKYYVPEDVEEEE